MMTLPEDGWLLCLLEDHRLLDFLTMLVKLLERFLAAGLATGRHPGLRKASAGVHVALPFAEFRE